MTGAILQDMSSEEVSRLLSIIEKFSGTLDKYALRREIAEDLLRLLHSDFIASFIWNEDRNKFMDAVYLNMRPENIARYDVHFQFCDPITPHLQARRRATLVCEVMHQNELEKTSFSTIFSWWTDSTMGSISMHMMGMSISVIFVYGGQRTGLCSGFVRKEFLIPCFPTFEMPCVTLVPSRKHKKPLIRGSGS